MASRLVFIVPYLFCSSVSTMFWMLLLLNSEVKAQAGALDNSFGQNGIVTLDVAGGNAIIYSVLVQPDNKIIASGIPDFGGTSQEIASVRFNEDGTLDTTFGNMGKVMIGPGLGSIDCYSSVLQQDGKIILAGDHGGPMLIRLNQDGSIDSSFSNDGFVYLTDGYEYFAEGGRGVVLQPDGKIIVTGSHWDNYWDFCLARYTTDGNLDASFGSGGKVYKSITANSDFPYGITLQPDGKIVLIGHSYGGYCAVVVRFNIDGSGDSNFNSLYGNFDTDEYCVIYDVALLPDEKILVAGFTDHNFTIGRLNSNGTPDTQFGAQGRRIIDIEIDHNGAASLLVQPDGKMLLGGSTQDQFIVVRLNQTGSIDSTFGINGIAMTDFSPTLSSDILYSMEFQPDGKIIAGGKTGDGKFALSRYFSDISVSGDNLPGKFPICSINPNMVVTGFLFNYSNVEDGLLQISDTYGKSLQKIQLEDFVQTRFIDVSKLPQGVYLVTLTSKGIKCWSGKVVIVK